MKKVSYVLLFILLTHSLFSLDIWINGQYYQSYSREELKEYSGQGFPQDDYAMRSPLSGNLTVSQIVPLFEEVYRIEAYGGRNKIVLEEPENLLDSLNLVFDRNDFYLSRGDYRFENPTRLDLWGVKSTEKDLIVIFPEEDDFTRERLDAYCAYHDLTLTAIPSDNPARELNNRIYQKKTLPHLVIFPESSLPSLVNKITENKDYYFSITALFSEKNKLQRPMNLDEILKESSHSYSWNSYDFETFSLFAYYYEMNNDNNSDSLKQALVLNRSLKEMGILDISSEPFRENKDFFLANTRDFPFDTYRCYPDFLTPLYDYTCIARPKIKNDSLLASRAEAFLLSSQTQDKLGWMRNGIYPVLNTIESIHPADPCLLLLNMYKNKAIRLSYTDELIIRMDNWQTLSRLAINSALSIDDLIESSRREEEGVF
jgi:hypothetical protein